MLIELTDNDILLRLTNTEDSTVERKAASDYRDCLKTAVAFSNSLPFGDPGVIFVGVFDDGRIQENHNLDSLQKKVSEEINKIYPPIYPQQKVFKGKGGRNFLAVIVRGSLDRPHFAGQAFIRAGSENDGASRSVTVSCD
jgi:predicted HTH transcriptional regulator